MTKSNIAILTNFQDFNPGYSLTGIVSDQCLMLLKNDHNVVLVVSENFNEKYNCDSGVSNLFKFANFTLIKGSKFMHLIDYQTATKITYDHIIEQKEAAEIYCNIFRENNIDVVFTHDFVFTGWNVPFAAACKTVTKMLKEIDITLKWYHWVHSIPSGEKDWWNLKEYGEKHYIVFPNYIEKVRVAEAFRTEHKNVLAIPHIKDIRTWYDFGEDSNKIIDACNDVINADFVQVYPCSTDRLSAKQLGIVIKIFSFVKKENFKVFLIIANQWATGRQRKEDINKYKDMGKKYGLIYGDDFIFTSEIDKKFELGISKKTLRELQLLSNIFIFPTKEESFGLVGPESVFSGALPVINKSLTMQFEVMSHECIAYDFGSFHQNTPIAKDNNYIKAVSFSILQHFFNDISNNIKTYCRKRYNMDYLYKRHYQQIVSKTPESLLNLNVIEAEENKIKE